MTITPTPPVPAGASSIILIGDRVLIRDLRPTDVEVEYKGLWLPVFPEASRGLVVAVGPGKRAVSTGVLLPMSVAVGDVVLPGKSEYAAEVALDLDEDGRTERYWVMAEGDILAVVEE